MWCVRFIAGDDRDPRADCRLELRRLIQMGKLALLDQFQEVVLKFKSRFGQGAKPDLVPTLRKEAVTQLREKEGNKIEKKPGEKSSVNNSKHG